MKYLSVLVFTALLCIKISLSGIRMVVLFIPNLFPLISSFLIGTTMVWAAVTHSSSNLSTRANQYLVEPSFSNYVLFLQQLNKQDAPLSDQALLQQKPFLSPTQLGVIHQAFLSNTNLDQEIEFWENALKQQPTSRDILYNLALLYRAKGDIAKANDEINQARQLDPNHHFDY